MNLHRTWKRDERDKGEKKYIEHRKEIRDKKLVREE